MQPTVTLFTSRTCPYCDELRDYFYQNKVAYTELKVDESEDAAREVVRVVGDQVVPVTIIQFGQASPMHVVGFDPQRLGVILETV